MTLHADRARLLADSRLYLCTDARREQGDLREFLDASYRGGVDIIQLRDKSIEARADIAALEILRDVAREHGKLFAVNDRADVAAIVGADVFHVGQGDLTTEHARLILGDDVLIGRSNNSLEDFTASMADEGLDYAVIGPVWPTPTKPGRPAVGITTVAEAAQVAPRYPARQVDSSAAEVSAEAVCTKPWFAIGGVDQHTVPDVVAHGAERVVVVRAVTSALDPSAAAATLREELPD